MKGYIKLTIIDLKLFLREPIGTFFTLGFPVMLVAILGAIFGNQSTPIFGGHGWLDTFMPSFMALILAMVGMMPVAINTSTYRETGVLRRYRATPLSPLVYIAADVTANLVMTLLGGMALVLTAWSLFHVRFPGNAASMVLAVILSGLAMFTFGYVIGSVAPSARAANVIGLVLFYPMIYLSGASMPIEILPAGIRRIAEFLPLTYVVRLLRGLWFGESWGAHWIEAIALVGILVIGTFVAAKTFRWE